LPNLPIFEVYRLSKTRQIPNSTWRDLKLSWVVMSIGNCVALTKRQEHQVRDFHKPETTREDCAGKVTLHQGRICTQKDKQMLFK
jgi:hypothetical protein